MTTALLIIGIILLLFALFLIVAVLMQQGKAHNLSGAIAGGAETFFGKSKASSINKKLSILTTVVAIVFVVLVCVVYVLQPNSQKFDWSMLNPFSSGAS
ncbi:MAG: preprotein translocase subunit SecG, partial [Clostridia bacterium]|nr:preprotein translocase subunit SecG [Clostridia bacterium]